MNQNKAADITEISVDQSFSDFEKILIATLKQSGNYWLPNIHKLEAFNDFIVRRELPKLILLAHCKDGKKQEIKNLADATKNQIVVIGPEGDFTLEEINQSIINKFLNAEFIQNERYLRRISKLEG